MPKSLHIAVAQPRTSPADIPANVEEHVRLIADAAADGADVCVFPELSLTGYELDAIASDPRCRIGKDDPRLEPLRQACRDGGIHALVGVALEEGGQLLLATLVFGPSGDTVDHYAKQHLHGHELDLFTPGTRHVVLDIGGCRLGLAICYDAAVPRHARELSQAGAEVYVVSALFGVGSEDRLREQVARAAGLGMWVALSQYSGTTGPFETFGGSGVWRPDGVAVAELGKEISAYIVAVTSY
jgi:predicted amidohydrolase